MTLLHSLRIREFRLFERLAVNGLTRVNLLVGKNNSGKTALLDAIECVVGGGTLARVVAGCSRRGETVRAEEEGRRLDICHLFKGHSMEPGAKFEISGDLGGVTSSVAWALSLSDEAIQRELPLEPESSMAVPPLVLIQETAPRKTTRPAIPLEADGSLDDRWVFRTRDETLPIPVRTIPVTGLPRLSLSSLWDRIVLTEEARRATEAMAVIVDGLEGVHFNRTGGWAKLQGLDRKIPLGSLGDGSNRFLSIAIALASTQHGYLLADEIDTGLHYTVMVDMWRLVVRTAQRLDLQVFATSHSLDCINALAWLVKSEPSLAPEISLHRVERGYSETTPYGADEIIAAARHHSELR